MPDELDPDDLSTNPIIDEQGTDEIKKSINKMLESLEKQDTHTRTLVVLTYILIAAAIITSIVGILTIIQSEKVGSAIDEMKNVTKKIYVIENFNSVMSISSTSSFIVDGGKNYSQTLVAKISFNSLSPHHLQLNITEANLEGNIFSSSCVKSPTISINSPIIKYVRSNLGNLDFDIPLIFTSDPKMMSPSSSNSSSIRISDTIIMPVIIDDFQTGKYLTTQTVKIPITILTDSVTLSGNC